MKKLREVVADIPPSRESLNLMRLTDAELSALEELTRKARIASDEVDLKKLTASEREEFARLSALAAPGDPARDTLVALNDTRSRWPWRIPLGHTGYLPPVKPGDAELEAAYAELNEALESKDPAAIERATARGQAALKEHSAETRTEST